MSFFLACVLVAGKRGDTGQEVWEGVELPPKWRTAGLRLSRNAFPDLRAEGRGQSLKLTLLLSFFLLPTSL